MIDKEKNSKAIKAIQDLIIKGRILAFEKVDHSEMFDFLDGVEYLPGLIIAESNTTKQFEDHLKSMCSDFDCIEVWNRYNAG